MLKKKIKVLQIMPEFGLAGAEIMCKELSSKLAETNDFSVIVVSLYTLHSSITDYFERKKIPIIFLNKKHGFDLSLIAKLKKIIKLENVDIIHTHRYTMQYALPAAIIAGNKTPIIHTVHNIANKEISKNRRKIAYLAYRFNRAIPIGISPLVKDSISSEYGLSIDNIPLIYNGIDLSRCIKKSDYSVKNKFKFIHVGRFSDQKNHIMILHAFRELVKEGLDVQLNLIGDGPLINDCKNKCHSLGIDNHVTFLGLRTDVHDLLSTSDCFILPSKYEGMPISLIEAMGTGLPVIVTDVGGMPDMIKNNYSGLVIDPSKESLIKAMKQIIHNSNLREVLGKNALHESKKFTSEEMTQSYIEIYKKALYS